jgi:hypothetical protein
LSDCQFDFGGRSDCQSERGAQFDFGGRSDCQSERGGQSDSEAHLRKHEEKQQQRQTLQWLSGYVDLSQRIIDTC